MSFKTFASPFALAAAAALTLSSAAFAQTMVGDQQISDEDLPAVTEHCAMLADADTAGDAAMDAPADAGADANADAADDEAAPDADAAADVAVDDAAGGEAALDLEAITLEDCQAAGLAM